MAKTQQKIELGEVEKNLLRKVKRAKLDGIKVEVIGTWLWVSGNTKDNAKRLKKWGFHYAPNKQMWYFHTGAYKRRGVTTSNIEDVKARYDYETLVDTIA